MSSNFTIYVEREAPVDGTFEGPNPAEDPGDINDANGSSLNGFNDGGEVEQENVGNVPSSDISRSNEKSKSSGQQKRRKSFPPRGAGSPSNIHCRCHFRRGEGSMWTREDPGETAINW